MFAEPFSEYGFCRVKIPLDFMWCDSPAGWVVIVNKEIIEDLIVTTEVNATVLYFTYSHGGENILNIRIWSSYAVAEFNLPFNLLVFYISTLIVWATLRLSKNRNINRGSEVKT